MYVEFQSKFQQNINYPTKVTTRFEHIETVNEYIATSRANTLNIVYKTLKTAKRHLILSSSSIFKF